MVAIAQHKPDKAGEDPNEAHGNDPDLMTLKQKVDWLRENHKVSQIYITAAGNLKFRTNRKEGFRKGDLCVEANDLGALIDELIRRHEPKG